MKKKKVPFDLDTKFNNTATFFAITKNIIKKAIL